MDSKLDNNNKTQHSARTHSHMMAHGHNTVVGLIVLTNAMAVVLCLRHGDLTDATHDDCDGGWLMALCRLILADPTLLIVHGKDRSSFSILLILQLQNSPALR